MEPITILLLVLYLVLLPPKMVLTIKEEQVLLDDITLFKLDEQIEKSRDAWFSSDTEVIYPFTDIQWAWFNSLSTYYEVRNVLKDQEVVDDGTMNFENQEYSDPPCDEINTQFLTRKEWRRMSDEERSSYIDAYNSLANFYPDPADPYLSGYHLLVWMHRFPIAPGAHIGAPLLPWHREYIWRFSNALRQQGYIGDLPYFDSIVDRPLPNPSESALWTEENMGLITPGPLSSPFQNLRLIDECAVSANTTRITREAPTSRITNKFLLFSHERLEILFNFTCFRDLTLLWSNDSSTSFETFHDYGHIFVGGTMLDVLCSPQDPHFLLHHNFLDLIWEEFRRNYQQTNVETEYPLTNVGFIPQFQKWNSPFYPFDGIRPYSNGHNESAGTLMIQGMSNHYTNFYYNFDTRPSAIVCETDIDCTGINGSDLLWCDTSTSSCIGKIRENGNCDIDLPDNQCWCPRGTAVCEVMSALCQC